MLFTLLLPSVRFSFFFPEALRMSQNVNARKISAGSDAGVKERLVCVFLFFFFGAEGGGL